jgi:hypothetical protein
MLNFILNRRTRVRSAHLHLTELSTGLVQMDLFADLAAKRHSKLEAALDQLRRRYGGAVVGAGSAGVSPAHRREYRRFPN